MVFRALFLATWVGLGAAFSLRDFAARAAHAARGPGARSRVPLQMSDGERAMEEHFTRITQQQLSGKAPEVSKVAQRRVAPAAAAPGAPPPGGGGEGGGGGDAPSGSAFASMMARAQAKADAEQLPFDAGAGFDAPSPPPVADAPPGAPNAAERRAAIMAASEQAAQRIRAMQVYEPAKPIPCGVCGARVRAGLPCCGWGMVWVARERAWCSDGGH